MSKQVKSEKSFETKKREFLENPTINPDTGRTITDTGKKYKELCDLYGNPKLQGKKSKKNKNESEEEVKEKKSKKNKNESEEEVKEKKSKKNKHESEEEVKEKKSKKNESEEEVKEKKSKKNKHESEEEVKEKKSKHESEEEKGKKSKKNKHESEEEVKEKKSKKNKNESEEEKEKKNKNKKNKNESEEEKEKKSKKNKNESEEVKEKKSKKNKEKVEELNQSEENKNENKNENEKSENDEKEKENLEFNKEEVLLLGNTINKIEEMNKKYSIEHECSDKFWESKFDLDLLPYKKCKNFNDYVEYYKEVEKAKIEMEKLLKVALVTTNSKHYLSVKFKLDGEYVHLLPDNVKHGVEETGDVVIKCEIDKDFMKPYFSKNYPWLISFVGDEDLDDNTIEEVEVLYNDILLLLTNLEYYRMINKLNIAIVSEDAILTRNELNSKTDNYSQTLACYKLLDYQQKFSC